MKTSVTNWRLLIDPPLPPAQNMAIDEAIAIAFSEKEVPPTLRFYQWSVPAFSIGSFQTLNSSWLDYLNRSNIAVVRRMTGGRGLLHDREMTYSVVASTKNPLFSDGIKGTFKSIAIGLMAGLQEIGMEGKIHTPSQEKRRKRENAPLCFASTSQYEITAKGKKLIGSAQRRWRSHFLQHGSLILESRFPESHPSSESVPLLISEKQTALAELLERIPDIDMLLQAMKTGFEMALPIHLVQGKLTRKEMATTDRLIKEKYGNHRWNLHRKMTPERTK